MLATGAAGKSYIEETTRLINHWNSESESMKDITLNVMPATSQQSPKQYSTPQEQQVNLARCRWLEELLISKNFGKQVKGPCRSSAEMACIRCTKSIKKVAERPSFIKAYTSCRHIPLNKNPGVRHIGIGEVICRIIWKSIISIIKPEILLSAGSLQLCTGLPSKCEGATHTMREIFSKGRHGCNPSR